LKEFYAKWGAWFILIKGLTPIPYKLVTIVSGALDYNLILFIVLSLMTRGARFFILAGIFNRWGGPLKIALEKHLALIASASVAIVVFGFWLAVKVI
jgi:membrane protein DedA with SNARE-associated domain